MKTFTTILLLVVTSFSVSAQKKQDTILAYQYYQKAETLLKSRKIDSSIAYFKKALPIYEKAEIWERVVSCYNGVSTCYSRLLLFKEMFSNAESALKICDNYNLNNSKQKFYALDFIGEYYKLSGNYQKALENYSLSLYIKKKFFKENPAEIAYSYNKIGLMHRELYEYEKALQNYHKSLEIRKSLYGKQHKDVMIVYKNIADILMLTNDHKNAYKYLIDAKNVSEKILGTNDLETAYLYFDIGAYYFDTGYYDLSLEYYQKCLDIQMSNKDENPQNMAFTYARIAKNYNRKGFYDKVMEYFKKALIIEQNSSVRNPIMIGAYLNNIGLAYQNKGDLESALLYFEKAYSIYLKHLGNEHYRISYSYMKLGGVSFDKKEYNKAIDFFNKALEFRLKHSEKTPETGSVYRGISDAYKEMGDYKKALDIKNKEIEIYLELYSKTHPVLAHFFNEKSEIYYLMGNHNETLKNLNSALLANGYNQGYRGVENNVPLKFDDILDAKALLVTLNLITRVHNEKFKSSSDLIRLKRGVNFYKKSDSTVQYVRQNLSIKDKVFFSQQSKKTYEDAIESLFLLYNQLNDVKDLEQAFIYSEKSKSNTLKENLNSLTAKKFSGLNNELIKLEKELKITKAFYQSKISKVLSSKKVDSIKLSDYENELFDINRKKDSLTQVLEENYPKYYQLKYRNDVIAVNDIQKQLDKNTTLLEFFSTDSITYAFTISKTKFDVKQLPTPNLVDQVQQFQTVTNKNIDVFKNSLYQLYKDIVLPIKDQLTGDQLIIIPDGPLWHLNFDLLLTQPSNSNNPKTWPYLLKEYAISYANSATLLYGQRESRHPKSKELEECLAFSFSNDINSDANAVSLTTLRNTSADLPGTRKEIKAIANLMDGQYFYGHEASEYNFKKYAGNYAILHLALHGTVDNEKPENSKLFFTKTKDTLEDNYLYSHELFALNIPAELTVLSACNTGTGKIAKGEGIMSLGNAFQYAGTKSLLLTNWEVSDQTTPEIMKHFYTQLKKGSNKAKALQKAKLQYLASANEVNNHPFYWGGFYLLGDTAPVQLSSANYLYWILGVTILGILLFGVFWHKKKRS